MDKLKEKMLKCTDCDLCYTRTNVVFGDGVLNPMVLVLGEAPGEDEDLSGIPFVGKAGKKLDSIFNYVGLKRDRDLYITNSVLCRPPNNRKPTFEELAACRYRLEEQIKLLNPTYMILLGKTALEQLMNQPIKGTLSQFFPKNFGKEGGDWLTYKMEDRKIKTMVTYHPSYLLRSPEQGYKTVLPHWQMVKRCLLTN